MPFFNFFPPKETRLQTIPRGWRINQVSMDLRPAVVRSKHTASTSFSRNMPHQSVSSKRQPSSHACGYEAVEAQKCPVRGKIAP